MPCRFFLVVQDRFVVHLEFILFCLAQGDAEEAHQAAQWYGSNSFLCLVTILDVEAAYSDARRTLQDSFYEL
jgi:hypothetical protein